MATRVVPIHSLQDFEWACGHIGPAACCKCFDEQATRLKLAEAVCDAWAALEPMTNVSALRGKQLLAMQRAHDAYLAGKKEKDDGDT